ncbi:MULTISPECIES: glycosyltransferase family 2 protein [unclassified Fibrobacter]|uniref:glycosyltransferase family 2 protein n=1 Tax=unclassified Fibrobacter TaxID=2634177 RepID=UPI000D6A82C7
MKITLITSCFNREKTIAGAIRSVLSQDYDNIEYIIVDGKSRDSSFEVIKEAVKDNPHNFEIKIVSEPDHGMYEAINKGIRMATGDVIGLVHSDDFLYDNNVVSQIVKRFDETSADFVYGDGIFVQENNTSKIVRRWISGWYARFKVRLGWLPLHPTCYIKREMMDHEGLYDESYRIAADTDLLVRYLYYGFGYDQQGNKRKLKVAYLRRFVVKMRMGGLSTDPLKRKQMWNEDIRVYRGHGFFPAILIKILKMTWKVPQFVMAKIKGV